MHYQSLNPKLYINASYMREAHQKCYENNVTPINGMDMWPTVDIEEMLPSKHKKGPSRHTKLRFREHDERCSRMMRPGLTCRCTKCDKFGNNSRKFQSNEHGPNALKRKVAYHKLAILHFIY